MYIGACAKYVNIFPCKMHLAHNIYCISAMYYNLDITKSITRAFGCIQYTTYNSILRMNTNAATFVLHENRLKFN